MAALGHTHQVTVKGDATVVPQEAKELETDRRSWRVPGGSAPRAPHASTWKPSPEEASPS